MRRRLREKSSLHGTPNVHNARLPDVVLDERSHTPRNDDDTTACNNIVQPLFTFVHGESKR